MGLKRSAPCCEVGRQFMGCAGQVGGEADLGKLKPRGAFKLAHEREGEDLRQPGSFAAGRQIFGREDGDAQGGGGSPLAAAGRKQQGGCGEDKRRESSPKGHGARFS